LQQQQQQQQQQSSSRHHHHIRHPRAGSLDRSTTPHSITQDVIRQVMNEESSFPHEVADVIELPKLEEDKKTTTASKDLILHNSNHSAKRNSKTSFVILSSAVRRGLLRQQLREYVDCIASSYKDLPFHNFEHASHAALSANKLFNRILTVLDNTNSSSSSNTSFESDLHKRTYGISSDPLLHFCVVFAALVHDVDHPGVPNAQLVLEKANVAIKYDNKSVAEKHSLEVALRILEQSNFEELQQAIYSDEKERKRFRQLLVNAVMATDITDLELQLLRKERWSLAFEQQQQQRRTIEPTLSFRSRHNKKQTTLKSIEEDPPEVMEEGIHRKATLVMEHIIQASDIAHTMQHWHVFCKWNERLFEEMYDAYVSGRTPQNPSDGWYQGQLVFFDTYVIPLAHKLKDCEVFGPSSDEYLSYALDNRREWAMKGKEVSREMAERKEKSAPSNST